MRHAATIVPALALALSAFVFSPCARAAGEISDSDKALIAKATEFASHWFSLVTAGDYDAAYAETTSDFQKNYPLEKWADSEREFAIKTGKLLEQTPAVLGTWERNPAGAPPGTYFLIYVPAKFENSDRCRMEIRIRLENGGSFHLLDYQRIFADKKTVQAMREFQEKYAGARFPTEKITKEEMENYYTEISILANWRGYPKDNTYVITDAESDTSYLFTAPGHPAHPAVIKIPVMGDKGMVKFGHFAGNEAAYREWFDSFKTVNTQDMAKADDKALFVLVDSIPSDAVALSQQVQLMFPPEQLKGLSTSEIEQGLMSQISSKLAPFATQNNVRFICLLPVQGEDMRAFAIPGNETKLMLSMKTPVILAVFYQGGRVEKSPVSFSVGKPAPKRSTVGISIKPVTMPLVSSPSYWVYFNLARIQNAAAKAGSPEVFLETSGTGKTVPVIIPGMKEPLQVFERDSEIKATWYVDPNKPDTWRQWR